MAGRDDELRELEAADRGDILTLDANTHTGRICANNERYSNIHTVEGNCKKEQ